MTPAQQESLDLLQEECGELIVIISKVKRFGLMSENPEQPGVSAQNRLIQEMGDVIALIDLVCKTHTINPLEVDQARLLKFQKLNKYSKHLKDTP